jgi:hydrogenase maturation protein HypF
VSLFEARPVRVACDLHPEYASSAFAQEWARTQQLPITLVQHHHAHVASLMAEHGVVEGSIIGVAFDGTGYGTDGTIWGGEVLVADYRRFERVAHLGTTMLPGGDAAVRHPGRVALAQLHAAGVPWHEALPAVAGLSHEGRRILAQQLERGIRCVASSSMGRFLDAAAALCGVRQRATYEGQAAIEFEVLAATSRSASNGWSAASSAASSAETQDDARYAFLLAPSDAGPLTFSGGPVLQAIVEDVLAGVDKARIAWRVHEAIADAVVRIATRIRVSHGLGVVGLTGGVFQNVVLLTLVRSRLRATGFKVLTHQQVPPNDGGLALGQAMIAAAHHEAAVARA